MSARTTTSGLWRDRNLYLAFGGLALVVLTQATLLSRIHFIGAQPDLLLVLVVCMSLFYGINEGLLLAFAGGLALDVITGFPLGTSPLALMPVCFLGVIGRKSVYVNNLVLPMLLVALATPVQGVLMLFIRELRGMTFDWGGAMTHVVLPALGLNLILTVLLSRPLRRFSTRARLEPVG